MKTPAFGPKVSSVFLVVLAVLADPPSAQACACCADPGERVETARPLETFEKAELEKVRFAKASRLFMSAAGAAGVRGVEDPTDSYEITLARDGDRWTFTGKDAKGKTGTLAFAVPANIESFFVDLHDGKPGTEPVLYKEWRLTAPVTASGIFGASASGGVPTLRLVLQGRGNACTSASQFTSYTLAVSGPSARFSLFGALASPAP